MQEILGWLAMATFWLLYPGLLFQIRKTWREEKSRIERGALRAQRSLSIPRMSLEFGRYVSWIVYGAALVPTDGFMIGARVPMLFVMPIILYQVRNPCFTGKELLRLILVCALGASILGSGLWLLQPFLEKFHGFLGLLVVGVFILGLSVGIPDQVRKLKRHGNRDVSGLLQGLFLLNYFAWLAYGIACANWVLIVCYSMVIVGQLWIIRLMARHSRRLERAI